MFEAGNETKEVRIFTGLATFMPILVNPTKEELTKIGVNLKDEPVYTTKTEEGNDRTRVDIWGQIMETSKIVGSPQYQKVSFFIENTFKESTATPGNFQFINEFGLSTWGQNVEEITEKYGSWFKGDKIRKAYSGEADLVSFINSWLSIGKGQKSGFENPVNLTKGDVTELKTIISKFKERKLQVLLTVREYEGSYFQSIYNRYTSRSFNKSTTYWEKHFENSQANVEYQNSFALKEFNPLAVSSSETDTAPEADPWA